jgi:hypothetical protein
MHRILTKPRSRIALALAGAVVATTGSLALAPADAVSLPPPKVAKNQDTYVKLQCRFTVTSVNYATGVLRGRLTAQTSPNGYVNGRQVASMRNYCAVSANFVDVASIDTGANGAYTYATKIVTVPFTTGYLVIDEADYKLKNGDTGQLFGLA